MTHELDKNAGATLGDLGTLAGEMSLRFDGVHAELKEMRDEMQNIRGEMQEIRTDISGLQRGQEAILNVITSIDENLRELKTLPVRVERLERSHR